MKKHKQRNYEKAMRASGFSSSVEEVNFNDPRMRAFLHPEEDEPLTEELIKELIEKGYEEKGLRMFAEQGFKYCRARDSIMGPVEYFSESEEEKSDGWEINDDGDIIITAHGREYNLNKSLMRRILFFNDGWTSKICLTEYGEFIMVEQNPQNEPTRFSVLNKGEIKHLGLRNCDGCSGPGFPTSRYINKPHTII